MTIKIIITIYISMLCFPQIHSMQQTPIKEKLLKNIVALQNFLVNNENLIINGIHANHLLCLHNGLLPNDAARNKLYLFCNSMFDQTNLKDACFQIDYLGEKILDFFHNNSAYEYAKPSKQERAEGHIGFVFIRSKQEAREHISMTAIYLIFLRAVLCAYNQVCLEDESFKNLNPQ